MPIKANQKGSSKASKDLKARYRLALGLFNYYKYKNLQKSVLNVCDLITKNHKLPAHRMVRHQLEP
jgi:hypothetical protein